MDYYLRKMQSEFNKKNDTLGLTVEEKMIKMAQ